MVYLRFLLLQILLPFLPTATPYSHYKLPLNATSTGLVVSFPIGKQFIHMRFDTGSKLSWVPCDSNGKSTNKSFFNPDLKTIISCKNPLCNNFFDNDLILTCDSNNLCSYFVSYADGGMFNGSLLKDKFANKIWFFFGCANSDSYDVPEGILGMNKDNFSFATQTKSFFGSFAYYLPQLYCNSTEGNLVLGPIQNPVLHDFQYVPMVSVKNPGNNFDPMQYSVALSRLKINNSIIIPITSTQTIVDSGTLHTYFQDNIFYPLLKMINSSAVLLNDGKMRGGDLEICCLSKNLKKLQQAVSQLSFEFGEGSDAVEMVVDSKVNVVTVKDNHEIFYCVPFARSGEDVTGNILGNLLFRGRYMEFNLMNQTVGIGKVEEHCVA